MNYVRLMDRDPICPSFMGFQCSDQVSHRIEFRMPNVPGVFVKSYETIKCLRMCEKCNFPTVAEDMFSSDSPQPATNRKE